MCGHGLIGVVRTLQHLGRLSPGVARFDTPVGTVSAELNDDGSVTIENVAAKAHALDVAIDVPGCGRVVGDVAYGGNWFFITHVQAKLDTSNVDELLRLTRAMQSAIDAQRPAGGVPIDHIELSGAPHDARIRRAQLRALFRRRVRSFAVRHRHVGGDGGAAPARVTRVRAAVAAGEHHGRPLHRVAHARATTAN